MARKTYRTKAAAKRAAHGSEIYKVKGPPAGWRISRGHKVRGKRGRAQRARARRSIKRAKIKPLKRKKRKKSRKKTKRYLITLGNPHPEICGYPKR